MKKRIFFWIFLILAFLLCILFFMFPEFFNNGVSYKSAEKLEQEKQEKLLETPVFPPLDIATYDKKILEIANNPPPVTKIIKDPETGEEVTVYSSPGPGEENLWPVKTVYPNPGAILPFKRIIAYYGNLYSKKMGALGEYPEDEMLTRLGAEVKNWELADPATPVVP